MSENTREKLIHAAIAAFAEKGFYGASVDSIARQEGVTKQALLHHFGSKEKLYAEALERLSEEIMDQLQDAHESASAPADQLAEFFRSILHYTEQNVRSTQLLMRELLDNRQRAETVEHWYLKPFLESLSETLMEANEWSSDKATEAMSRIYAILGAINYFVVSDSTLSRMFGEDNCRDLVELFGSEIDRLVRNACLR